MGSTDSSRIVYGVDDRPPLGRSVIYGFQHIFAMILGSITGGVVIGETIGLNPAQIGQLIGYINVAVGIATILQVSVGVKLPIIQGSTMGHVPAYLALGSVGVSLNSDPTTTMQYLGGALLVGAILEAIFGFSNGLRWIKKVVSPMVIGIVIAMVGLGLWPVVNDFIGDGWLYGMGVIVFVILAYFAFGVMVKTMALFIAVIVAYLIAALATAFGWISAGHPLFVDFAPIVQSSWITFPKVFPWGAPKFNLGFIFAMTIPYIATALESLGDYIAVADSSEVKTPPIKRLSRGIGVEGAASTISSILGGTASSSFSQNVGVVRMSGVASRYVCIVAGVLLLIIGVFGKLGVVLGGIPRVILGAVYLIAFGILVMTGFRLILRADIKSSRNEIIIGTSLLLGLALPAYMKENPIETESATLQVFLNVFLATPMMVSSAWALVLDNLIPGSPKERGMEGWLTAADQDSDPNDSTQKESE